MLRLALHGNEQGTLESHALEHLLRQAAGFRAEQERIAGAVLDIAVAVPPFGLDGEDPRGGECLKAGIEAVVNLDGRKIVIVEAGPLQALVVQAKSQRLDQMQQPRRCWRIDE